MTAQEQQPQLPQYPAGRSEPDNPLPGFLLLLALLLLVCGAIKVRLWWKDR
jgi:hypothetical protein